MNTLDYKGWKSTRLQSAAILFIAVTVAYIFGSVDSSQWIDFVKWVFGIYAGSEVGHKASAAVKGE